MMTESSFLGERSPSYAKELAFNKFNMKRRLVTATHIDQKRGVKYL